MPKIWEAGLAGRAARGRNDVCSRRSSSVEDEFMRSGEARRGKAISLRWALAGGILGAFLIGCAGNDFIDAVHEADRAPYWSTPAAQATFSTIEEETKARLAFREQWAEQKIEEMLKDRFPRGTPVQDLVGYLRSQDFDCVPEATRVAEFACELLLEDPLLVKFGIAEGSYRNVRWRINVAAEEGLIRTVDAVADIGKYGR